MEDIAPSPVIVNVLSSSKDHERVPVVPDCSASEHSEDATTAVVANIMNTENTAILNRSTFFLIVGTFWVSTELFRIIKMFSLFENRLY